MEHLVVVGQHKRMIHIFLHHEMGLWGTTYPLAGAFKSHVILYRTLIMIIEALLDSFLLGRAPLSRLDVLDFTNFPLMAKYFQFTIEHASRCVPVLPELSLSLWVCPCLLSIMLSMITLFILFL